MNIQAPTPKPEPTLNAYEAHAKCAVRKFATEVRVSISTAAIQSGQIDPKKKVLQHTLAMLAERVSRSLHTLEKEVGL